MKKVRFFLWLIYCFCLVILADFIFGKFENIPIETNTVTLQMESPSLHQVSEIPGLFYELKPNAHWQDVKTNSLGLRDQEYSIPKPDNTFRILVLGDSVTYAPGIKQEDRFTEVLERMLNRNSQTRYEVLNAGVCGYNTMQEYIALKEKYYIYDPDLTIIAYCAANDIMPSIILFKDSKGVVYKDFEEKFENNPAILRDMTPSEILSVSMPSIFHFPHKVHRNLLLISSLYRSFCIHVYDFLSVVNKEKYLPRVYTHLADGGISIKALEKFYFYSVKHKKKLVAVIFPELDYHRHHEKMKQTEWMVTKYNFPSVNLVEYYKRRDVKMERIRQAPADTTHLNKLGHLITGEILYEVLTDTYNSILKHSESNLH